MSDVQKKQYTTLLMVVPIKYSFLFDYGWLPELVNDNTVELFHIYDR